MPEDAERRENGFYEREFARSIERRFDQSDRKLDSWIREHRERHKEDREQLPELIAKAANQAFDSWYRQQLEAAQTRGREERQEMRDERADRRAWHQTRYGRIGIITGVVFGLVTTLSELYSIFVGLAHPVTHP